MSRAAELGPEFYLVFGDLSGWRLGRSVERRCCLTIPWSTSVAIGMTGRLTVYSVHYLCRQCLTYCVVHNRLNKVLSRGEQIPGVRILYAGA